MFDDYLGAKVRCLLGCVIQVGVEKQQPLAGGAVLQHHIAANAVAAGLAGLSVFVRVGVAAGFVRRFTEPKGVLL